MRAASASKGLLYYEESDGEVKRKIDYVDPRNFVIQIFVNCSKNESSILILGTNPLIFYNFIIFHK